MVRSGVVFAVLALFASSCSGGAIVPSSLTSASPEAAATPAVATSVVASTAAPTPSPIPVPVVVRAYDYPKNPAGKYFGLEITREITIYAPFDGVMHVTTYPLPPEGKLYGGILLSAETQAAPKRRTSPCSLCRSVRWTATLCSSSKPETA